MHLLIFHFQRTMRTQNTSKHDKDSAEYQALSDLLKDMQQLAVRATYAIFF